MADVLFVCVHNAGRSQMAEALFNHHARNQDISLRAASAGTVGGSCINPTVLELMRERGISMEGHAPKQLTQELVDAATHVITMGCGVDAEACPARFLVTEDWGLDDPKGRTREEVERICDEIERRVLALLDQMAN